MELSAFRQFCDSLYELSPGQRQTVLDQLQSRFWLLQDANTPWIERLCEWSDADLRRFLVAVPLEKLALALKGRSAELHRRIFSLLSAEQAKAMAEEMEPLGPARLSQVEAVLDEIRRLALPPETDGEQA